MSSAADFIQALQRRLRLTQFRSRPGEFPPGWQAWFDGMRARSGAVTGASVDAIIAVFLQRPLTMPPQRALALNRWQAFSTLWRQEWQPPAREERWLRALAAAVSGLVHLAFAVLLLWLGIVQLVAMSAPPRGEETVVMVQYIGTGAEQVGGGPIPEVEPEPDEPVPAQPAPSEVTRAPQPVADPSATAEPRPEPVPDPPPGLPRLPDIVVPTETPRLQAAPPEVVQREIPEPTVAEQPLVVSKPVPDRSRFTLQAPTIQVPEPGVTVTTPDLQLPQPSMQVSEVPEALPEFRPDLPPVRIEQPAIRSGVPELVVREVATPLPRIALPEPAPVDSVPELQPQVSQVRERRIPTPAAPAAEPAPAPAPTPASDAVATREAPAPTEVPAPATEPATPVASTPSPASPDAVTGAGPEPVTAPGGWPAPTADDSWDLAESEEPGPEAGQPDGIFDSQGRVQLAETPGPGSASPGLPPGTVTEEIANLDRAGTWLRRPPIDYEPTAFAEYWRPNETLIAEWVRKSIMTVRIPIPGTSKSLVCKTVLLAVGGACDIFDPNLNEQPATARPPPDVPFKPELQQSSGSVPPAG